MLTKKAGDFMLYHPVNGTIPVGDSQMDYISFGNGSRHMLMIPGLGEGLQSVKGLALPFALMYRSLSKRYRVTVFSRRREVPEGFTTRDMAEDIRRGMDALGIESACVLGISLGGMVVQHLAIDHPQRVEKLILTVTLPCPNPTLTDCLPTWIDMARRGDYPALMADTALRSYTDAKLKKDGLWMYRLTGRMVKRSMTDRFVHMAQAGLTHDTTARLGELRCPTLIIGGEQDKIVDGKASHALHRLIPHSKLYMYPHYGHGLYEEASDFFPRVIEFFG